MNGDITELISYGGSVINYYPIFCLALSASVAVIQRLLLLLYFVYSISYTFSSIFL